MACEVTDKETQPSSSVCSETPVSASKIKIKNYETQFSENESDVNGSLGYILIDLNILSKVLGECVCCKVCGGPISLHEDSEATNGLARKLIIDCASCKYTQSFWNSDKCKDNLYEVNVRYFYGLRAIGKGHSAAETMCAVLNMPRPPCKIDKYTGFIGGYVESVACESMKSAANDAAESNDGKTDIPVAFDGTWQKRGYSSKNSVATVTSVDTGKVIDFQILTKHCYKCKSGNQAEHICDRNYEGTSGGMEASAAIEIFSRSMNKRGVCYTKFLGDGDSKAYNSVVAARPYGDKIITKLECVGHVQKRMGTRLRKLKLSLSNKKLSDGKTIRGRLTDKIIDELQQYYGMAIRNNTDDLFRMRQAVWATYFHKMSTDDKPTHQLCPTGPDSWCKYRKAQHKHFIQP